MIDTLAVLKFNAEHPCSYRQFVGNNLHCKLVYELAAIPVIAGPSLPNYPCVRCVEQTSSPSPDNVPPVLIEIIGNANLAVIQYRRTLCDKCEFKDGGLCQLCGCPIDKKVATLSEKCPADKWGPVDTKEKGGCKGCPTTAG